MSTISSWSRRAGKSYSDEEEAKTTGTRWTGNRSLNSACRRLSCIGRLSVDLRQQQHSAALWATKQPSLGTALFAPRGDGPRKGGLNKACLGLTWLASRGQRVSPPSGKKNNERNKRTVSLNVACRNVRTMQDSENRPQ